MLGNIKNIRRYLKKFYRRETLQIYGIRAVLQLFKKDFKPEGKILIKSCDGIGDLFIKSKLAELLIERYGKDNVYFLLKSHYCNVGEMLGYNCIAYSERDKTRFFPRLMKMKALNSMGFSTYINLEFINGLTTANLFIPQRMGRVDGNWDADIFWKYKRFNKYYTKPYEISAGYVLEQLRQTGEKLLDKKLSLEDVTPDLSSIFPCGDENIVVSAGSTNRFKVCSPKIMQQYLKEVLKTYPEKEILLVGHGEIQAQYADELLQALKSDRVKSMVNKTSLKEVFDLVAQSFLFIGFDSGLYNLAFTLKKRGIIIMKDKSHPFYHKCEHLQILEPLQVNREAIDCYYSDCRMNSVTLEQFTKALDGD